MKSSAMPSIAPAAVRCALIDPTRVRRHAGHFTRVTTSQVTASLHDFAVFLTRDQLPVMLMVLIGQPPSGHRSARAGAHLVDTAVLAPAECEHAAAACHDPGPRGGHPRCHCG